VSDRIKVEFFSKDSELLRALKNHEDYVKAELLATELILRAHDAPKKALDIQIEDKSAEVIVNKIT
jgi:hypothetical protein